MYRIVVLLDLSSTECRAHSWILVGLQRVGKLDCKTQVQDNGRTGLRGNGPKQYLSYIFYNIHEFIISMLMQLYFM